VMLYLAVQYRRRGLHSPLSFFLVRAVFAGHQPTLPSMCYKIWTLVRSLSVICISQSDLTDVQQALGLLLVLSVTMLLESVMSPRFTHAMSLLDRFEELVIFVVICLGMLHSGDSWDTFHRVWQFPEHRRH
jgi:hypothetical protein